MINTKYKKYCIRNNNGLTLLLSVVLVFTLTILALGVLTLTGSENNLAQAQIDRIKADQLAKGIFFLHFTQAIHNTNPFQAGAGSEILDGKQFNYNVTVTEGTGLLGSDTAVVTVTFF